MRLGRRGREVAVDLLRRLRHFGFGFGNGWIRILIVGGDRRPVHGRAEHPGVLAAAALAAVDHQLALGQGDPGEPAGQHPDVVTVVDRERTKINMPRPQIVVDQGRHGGQLHHRLRDPAARILEHPATQRIQLLAGGPRADHDALAARAVDGLDHQLGQPVQHLFAGLVLLQPPRVHVVDDRLRAQVVADQVGDVGVEQLVVGDPVAHRVGQGHTAVADRVDQAGDAEHGVAAEVHRIDEVVVDPPIDHVDPLRSRGGAHEDPAPPALQIAAFDQLDAHGSGEQGVLEVGRVVDPGGEHDHGRVVDAGRRGLAERPQ